MSSVALDQDLNAFQVARDRPDLTGGWAPDVAATRAARQRWLSRQQRRETPDMWPNQLLDLGERQALSVRTYSWGARSTAETRLAQARMVAAGPVSGRIADSCWSIPAGQFG
jgi:hypothetical protein